MGENMEEIQNSIEIFDRIRKYSYKIKVENGLELILRFSREHYHHLAGYHHLTDMSTISKPASKQRFYGDLKKKRIGTEQIKKSFQYHLVHERITSFDILEQLLNPGTGKIIVDFDKTKTESVINARFHLFHRTGNPFQGESVFYSLFIDRERSGIFFPVTYVVEHSNMYVRGQTMYECTIERIPIGKILEPV